MLSAVTPVIVLATAFLKAEIALVELEKVLAERPFACTICHWDQVMVDFLAVGYEVGAELEGADVGRFVSPFFVGFEVIGRLDGRLDG